MIGKWECQLGALALFWEDFIGSWEGDAGRRQAGGDRDHVNEEHKNMDGDGRGDLAHADHSADKESCLKTIYSLKGILRNLMLRSSHTSQRVVCLQERSQ